MVWRVLPCKGVTRVLRECYKGVTRVFQGKKWSRASNPVVLCGGMWWYVVSCGDMWCYVVFCSVTWCSYQTHLIAQDGVHAVIIHLQHPLQTLKLIIPVVRA
jgi:hypothetical protein